MKKPTKIDVLPVDPLDALYLFDQSPIHTQFMIARSQAIEQYANIENALATICAHLMGITPDICGVMFYKMNNARSRLMVIDRLLHKKHNNTYNLFWNSLFKELRQLDDRRNLIVHWITKKSGQSSPCTNGIFRSSLIAPNTHDVNENASELFQTDLYEFILKCDFFYQLLMNFWWTISNSPKERHASWPQIFLEPVTYPPPRNHPLFRNWKELGTQPQPSPR